MPQGQRRVVQEHPGSGKSHHLPDLLPHLRLIAVHSAVAAECLFFHKRTFLAAEPGVFGEFPTGRTQPPCLPVIFSVIFPAVQADHLLHHILLFLPLLFHISVRHNSASGRLFCPAGTVLIRVKKYTYLKMIRKTMNTLP